MAIGVETRTGLVGSPVRRKEDAALVTGRGQFVDDIALNRVAHMRFVRSPHAHAQIESIDVSDATRIPGVLGVWTGSDLAHVAACRSVPGMERPVLAQHRARFVGEGVAVVVATDKYVAADAVRAVRASYTILPAAVTVEEALRPDAPVIVDGFDSNVVIAVPVTEADASAEVAAAPNRLSLRIVNQRVAPLPMETIACLADWSAGGLTVWATTQAAHRLRNDLSEMLEISQDAVRVISPDVGGGFGAKAAFYPEYLLCAVLSRELGRPVKAVESRTESMTAMTHGRAQVSELDVGFDDDGRVLAMQLQVDQDSGAYPEPVGVGLPVLTGYMAGGCYRVGKIGVSTRCIATNTTPVSAYRGAGRPEAAFLAERAMDAVAAALGRDPIDVRRRNLIPAVETPYATQFPGIVYDDSDFPLLLDTLLEHLDYEELLRDQAARRERGDERELGVGFSTWIELGGFGPTASLEVFGYVGGWESACVRMNPDGSVVVAVGTTPHGQGHETVFAQIAGDALGIGMERITVVHSDTAMVQEGTGTLGSRGVAVGGPAVLTAACELSDKLLTVAAHALGVPPERIERDGGRFVRVDDPDIGLDLSDVAMRAYKPDKVPEGMALGLEAIHRYEPANLSYPSGAHAAVVEVDVRTGLVRVVRYVAVDDCGTVINPLLARGQVEGGLAQGIAQALMEEVVYTADGHQVEPSLEHYPTPSAPDLPAYEAHHVEVPSSFNPLGAKGVGEAGATAAPQAVVNATLNALAPRGVRDLQMPLTPQRVWRALRDAAQPIPTA